METTDPLIWLSEHQAFVIASLLLTLFIVIAAVAGVSEYLDRTRGEEK